MNHGAKVVRVLDKRHVRLHCVFQFARKRNFEDGRRVAAESSGRPRDEVPVNACQHLVDPRLHLSIRQSACMKQNREKTASGVSRRGARERGRQGHNANQTWLLLALAQMAAEG